MEAAFEHDAVSFDPVVASPKGSASIDLQVLCRKPGMPPTMRALVERIPKPAPGPPYRRLDPQDLLVHVEGSMALCTFHLAGPTSLARRTMAWSAAAAPGDPAHPRFKRRNGLGLAGPAP